MIEWIKKFFFPQKITVSDYQKELKVLSKNELIAKMYAEAAKINRCDAVFDLDDKKELRKSPKRHLIKALVMMKIQNSIPRRKLRKIKNRIKNNADK